MVAMKSCGKALFNKLAPAFHASVLLLIMNFVITTDNVTTKFIVNNRTDALKLTSICFVR